jgi:hypothetical protein
MKLPMHTTSMPVTGAEARRVLRAVEAGRAATNPMAKKFASEIVAELRGKSRLASKRAR